MGRCKVIGREGGIVMLLGGMGCCNVIGRVV